jgi:hypothetical protein
MEIRIQEEDYEMLRHIAQKQNLDEDDIKRLAIVLQKVGVVMHLKEFIAIKRDDSIVIMIPGMTTTVKIDIYEGSVALNLQVENAINFNALHIELFPEKKDELQEFLRKMKEEGGGIPFDEHI